METKVVNSVNVIIDRNLLNIEHIKYIIDAIYQNDIYQGEALSNNQRRMLSKLLDLEKSNEKTGMESIERSINILDFAAKLENNPFASDEEYPDYEKIIQVSSERFIEEFSIQNTIEAAAICIKKLEFGKAHELLGNVVERLDKKNGKYKKYYKEFLLTGLIHYSCSNDINELKNLLSKIKLSSYETNEELEQIVADIIQEIFTRDSNLDGLQSALETIENIYQTASCTAKPALANSLGLVYRRIGERSDIQFLKKALNILRSGLKLNVDNGNLKANIKNNISITLIRLFELTKKEQYLNDAEVELNDCLKLTENIKDPRNYMIRPRVLNNIGNVKKQKALHRNDLTSAMSAISYYEEAENIWTKKIAPYEWAMLQKNKGEAKYVLGCLTKSIDLMKEALQNCEASIIYRDIDNSPHQWAKSVEVIFKIIESIRQIDNLKEVSSENRDKISHYLKIIDSKDGKWTHGHYSAFSRQVEIARNSLLIKTVN